MGEFAIGGYNGLYFGQLTQSNIGISKDSFLKGKRVKQVNEFAPNKFLVGIDEEPGYQVIDRLAARIE